MAFKRIRNRKVYEQSVYHYKSTPTIMLLHQTLFSSFDRFWLKNEVFYGTISYLICETN